VGASALAANTTGSFSTAVGAGALAAQNGAVQNVAVGNDAAGKLTSGNQNTAVGISTLGWGASVATTGTFNATFGQGSLYLLTSGSYNTALGAQALYSNTAASNNTAVGYQAAYSNTTAPNNTAVGYKAGYTNSTGLSNVSVGESAGYLSTGDGNTFIGQDAGYYVSTGAKNTILGGYNGNQGSLDIRTASNYIVLSDGDGNPRGYCDNVGNWVFTSGSATASPLNTRGVSGDTVYQSILVSKFDNNSTTSQNFIQFQINNGGANCGKITANGANTAAFGSTSDQRVKENIVELPSQLANIMALRPVEYDYLESYGGGHQIGFIAQEMRQVYPDVISEDDSSEKIMSITGWSKTEARLVKAIQEQQALIVSLKARLDAANL
jgi:hypothetical protein